MIIMKALLIIVFITCVIGIIGSFNSKVKNFFGKMFHKVFD